MACRNLAVLTAYFVLQQVVSKKHVLSRDRLALLGPHEGEGMLLHLQGL